MPLMLGACVGAGPVADVLARDAARAAVDRAVAARAPGVRVAPVTDCVIDNASAVEIAAVARDAASGSAGLDTAEIVGRVLSRPATADCLVRALPELG